MAPIQNRVCVAQKIETHKSQREKKRVTQETAIDIPEIPRKISNSPNFKFYVDAVRARWSFQQLEDHAERVFGEQISRETFRRLALLIPEVEKIPKHYQESVLNGIDVDIDVYREMQNTIALQRAIVTRLVELQTSMGGIPLPQTTEAVKLLWQMERELANLQITLGILKLNGNGNGRKMVEIDTERMVIKRLAVEMPAEERKQVLEAIYRARGVEITDLELCSDEVFVSEQAELTLEPVA